MVSPPQSAVSVAIRPVCALTQVSPGPGCSDGGEPRRAGCQVGMSTWKRRTRRPNGFDRARCRRVPAISAVEASRAGGDLPHLAQLPGPRRARPRPVLPAAGLRGHQGQRHPPGGAVGDRRLGRDRPEFVSKWDKWIGPIGTNASQLASQLTGGLANQLGQILDELSVAIMKRSRACSPRWGTGSASSRRACRRATTTTASTGPTSFHYRRTYQFPFVLFAPGPRRWTPPPPTTSGTTPRPGWPSRWAG